MATEPGLLRTLMAQEWRLLTFRAPGEAMRTHWRAFLVFGFVATWLAGIGRYWDNPRALWWQHLGLGSLAYVVVLSLLVWLLLMPLRPKRWSYRNVLLFVTLTAPPAILYAIPVERFLASEAAIDANIWFLAVVATWRVALYAVFLKRTAGLATGPAVVGTLLPLVAIVCALAALNLEHVVFNLMGGNPESASANDGAYMVVLMLTAISVWTAPFLLVAYAVYAYLAREAPPPESTHE